MKIMKKLLRIKCPKEMSAMSEKSIKKKLNTAIIGGK